MPALRDYTIVTPARNEAQFIEATIRSVVAQTVRPVKWVIVSDGSSDGTDDLVRTYTAQHTWIELLRMPERAERHFAGKVHAFEAGHARLEGIKYDAIACLDADLSFESGYFEYLLGKLTADPRLGLVGTPFVDVGSGKSYDYRFASLDHVSGACQLFRRECFESIGGYMPVKGGNVDHIAVLAARMKGWKTRTFTEYALLHYRPMGTAGRSFLAARFANGLTDYSIGNHPFWELLRAVYQMANRPLVLGGLMIAAGYTWAGLRRVPRPVSPAMVRFYRREQMRRLRRSLGLSWFTSAEKSAA